MPFCLIFSALITDTWTSQSETVVTRESTRHSRPHRIKLCLALSYMTPLSEQLAARQTRAHNSPACSPHCKQRARACETGVRRWWRTDPVQESEQRRECRGGPMTASHYQQRPCRCPLLLPLPCAPVPCCMPRRAVAPRRGTQLIPHSHVQSTQPRGATHMLAWSTISIGSVHYGG